MNKQTVVILLVAVAMVALLLVFENPFKGAKSEGKPKEQVRLFSPISEEECSKIQVSGFGTTATLVRKDREWFTADGYKADPDAVHQIFRALDQFGEPELISINPKAFVKFRVDNFLGTRLKMYDTSDRLRVDLIVGQLANDFFHTPVRKPGSNNVYRVRGMLRGVVGRRNWRDYNIFRFDVASLRRISVRTPEESYTIERDGQGGPWRFSEPTSAPVDTRTVSVWTQRIANLRAADFEPTTASEMLTTFGLTNPQAWVSVELDDGSSYTLVFGKLDEKRRQYYAKRNDDAQVYRIAQYLYNDVLKKSNLLKPKPKPTPRPASKPKPTPSAKGKVKAPPKPTPKPPAKPSASGKSKTPAKPTPKPPAKSSAKPKAKPRPTPAPAVKAKPAAKPTRAPARPRTPSGATTAPAATKAPPKK